ncbi:DUF5107 domain-containing protein [Acidobacteria bacterium AB60]|nr:DUF5107 domain-containing protein [Acidobacteria bacterium AB60]
MSLHSLEGTSSATQGVLLPEAPPSLCGPVKAWEQEVEILTYEAGSPERNPMFLERRVYQGSSGKVYPLPFIDRIATNPAPRSWKALHLENDFLRIMILPEIGGRIHVGYDKTTGYDFFYRQNVIKPALVGLAGPWISGGVEFNWPQHHRPATFLAVTTEIEEESDGSMTIWCSDHDPLQRLKGMHGVCLRPGRRLLELKVRLYNRTPFTQTFLWWANAATRVHEQYQSFFPSDVRFVADHARRAITSFPRSGGSYYGIDYGTRARHGVPDDEMPRHFVPNGQYPPDDLSWYANIPVPTSYMGTGTEQDFFGGYDHKADAGVVHVANHHISPGKKQWTWGNHEFGYAWDRNLTENDGPYIELMAGVYTDNQPDFSYLGPWETKTFTQNWYPIHAIGTPVAANAEAALSVRQEHGKLRIGICVTAPLDDAMIRVTVDGAETAQWKRSIPVADPLLLEIPLEIPLDQTRIAVTVHTGARLVIEYESVQVQPASPPAVANEPATPEEIETIEELYLTGLHLEQYRHATRMPETYWTEGLRRDPQESRIHNAMGLWHLRRGEFEEAVRHFRSAIARLTALNPNPRDGEPFYNLGLAYRYQRRNQDAYGAFYKATWNAAWKAPAYFALAECDAAARQWTSALSHLDHALRSDPDNLSARNLKIILLAKSGNTRAAQRCLEETLELDPLDVGARWQNGIPPSTGQESLDLAFDLMRAGLHSEARRVLEAANLDARDGSVPMIRFTLAWIQERLSDACAEQTLHRANDSCVDYCFPSRLEEMVVLEWACATAPSLWMPPYLLGNLLYDRRRYEEAIEQWENAARRNPAFATVYRNLGIAYYNVRHDPDRALRSFEAAFEGNPQDARVLYERDQLWKRTGRPPRQRLQELLRHPSLLEARDDLSVEVATLLNQTGKPDEALSLLLGRRFQPWEGGEGLVLGQYVRARLMLGRRSLQGHRYTEARDHFLSGLEPPPSLGEAWHLLASRGHICFWLGKCFELSGDRETARAWWGRAAQHEGDFQRMSAQSISDMTFWTALALSRLGKEDEATALFARIYEHAANLERTPLKIDYFATSLPAMLLFHEDLDRRNTIDALFLRAQALLGLHRKAEAEQILQHLLNLDCSHTGASDLASQLDDFNDGPGL